MFESSDRSEGCAPAAAHSDQWDLRPSPPGATGTAAAGDPRPSPAHRGGCPRVTRATLRRRSGHRRRTPTASAVPTSAVNGGSGGVPFPVGWVRMVMPGTSSLSGVAAGPGFQHRGRGGSRVVRAPGQHLGVQFVDLGLQFLDHCEVPRYLPVEHDERNRGPSRSPKACFTVEGFVELIDQIEFAVVGSLSSSTRPDNAMAWARSPSRRPRQSR